MNAFTRTVQKVWDKVTGRVHLKVHIAYLDRKIKEEEEALIAERSLTLEAMKLLVMRHHQSSVDSLSEIRLFEAYERANPRWRYNALDGRGEYT